MRVIGLLGGMSWESSIQYYQKINQGVKARLGGLHSAELVLYSIDFAELEALQHAGEWDKAAAMMIRQAQKIQAAGADCLVICTNTMHIVAEQVANAIHIPLLHIADAVAQDLVADEHQNIALLGTEFTMTQPFYRERLHKAYGLTVVTPTEQQRQAIHSIIYQELCLGIIKPESKQVYLEIINDLQTKGAQAVILGCTEIGLLIQESESALPLYDSVDSHVKQALRFALS